MSYKLKYKIINFETDILKKFENSLELQFNKIEKKNYNIQKIVSYLSKNAHKRSLYYEICNSMPSIYELMIHFKEKYFNNMLVWSNPLVRLDFKGTKKFKLDFHKDEWTLDSKLEGWVVWIPLIKKGGELITAKGEKLALKKGNYNAIDIEQGKIKDQKEIKIKYGQALIFHKSLLHKSSHKLQFSIQLRFCQINYKKKFFKRSHNKILDKKITKKILSKSNI